MPTNRLMGTYKQSMDVKGRMAFPAKLRECIGESFIVTKGVDGCLFVYSNDEFDKIIDRIDTLPMARALPLQRTLVGSAVEVEADKQGRILVPQVLRGFAELEKDVVVMGVSNHCEIWNPERWESTMISDEMLTKALEGADF